MDFGSQDSKSTNSKDIKSKIKSLTKKINKLYWGNFLGNMHIEIDKNNNINLFKQK